MPTTDDLYDLKSYVPEDLPNQDRRSAYVKAKERFKDHFFNPCPHRCGMHLCDARQLCKHYRGMTVVGNPKLYHPLVKREPPANKDGTRPANPERYDYLDSGAPVPVPKDAHLVRVSINYRVYVAESGVGDLSKPPETPEPVEPDFLVGPDDDDLPDYAPQEPATAGRN